MEDTEKMRLEGAAGALQGQARDPGDWLADACTHPLLGATLPLCNV